MKTPKPILENIVNGSLQRSSTSRTPIGEERLAARPGDPIDIETKSLVNMVFARFMAIYGHKFKSVFDSDEELRIAKREWALSLKGFTERELVHAVNHCKEHLVWMPTISEFLGVLRREPEEFGLPPTLGAYEEACRYSDHPREHRWSHPAVFYAGRATDWYRLRTEEKSQVFRDFEHNYQQLCRRVMSGEELDVPLPQALPDKSSNTLVAFIQRWGEEQQVTPEQAATLLYYLFKPKGSPVREQMKTRARERARDWGLQVSLPDDYQ